MSALKQLWDENPKSVSFVMGMVVALVLVMILYFVFREHFVTSNGSLASEFALLHGVIEEPNPAVVNPAVKKEHFSEVEDGMPSQAKVDPRFFPMAEVEKDNDDKATELLIQSRGNARRAILDGSRAKYLGLAKLGGMDYEGYKWDERPSNDENGLLNARVWGIDENYEKYPF